MTDILTLANWLLPLLYLALLIRYAAAFFLRTPLRGASIALPVTIGLHAAFLVALGVHLGRIAPVNNFEVLSVVALATTAVYYVVELASKERRTGMFVIKAVFLLQYTSSIFLPGLDLIPSTALAVKGDWTRLHIIPAIFAYTALTISAIHAFLHLVAQNDLKKRRFGLLFDRLPPLELLGTMTWHSMLTGFVFLTLVCVSGPLMRASSAGSGHMEAKLLFKIVGGAVAWIVYAIAIGGRLWRRWDQVRISRLVLGGFAVIIAILVGSIVLTHV